MLHNARKDKTDHFIYAILKEQELCRERKEENEGGSTAPESRMRIKKLDTREEIQCC